MRPLAAAAAALPPARGGKLRSPPAGSRLHATQQPRHRRSGDRSSGVRTGKLKWQLRLEKAAEKARQQSGGKLSESEARRLRAKVADPSGFAGLEIEDTGYESFEELVVVCPAEISRCMSPSKF